MKLNPATLRALFLMEIRMVLRDRRMILTSIVLPLLVMPLMLFSSSWTTKKREQKLATTVYRYAITGSQAAFARAWVAKIHTPPLTSGRSGKRAPFKLEEVTCSDALAALTKGDIHFVLEGASTAEARPKGTTTGTDKGKTARAGKANAKAEVEVDEGETPMPGIPVLRLVFRADRDDSAAGIRRMREALRETRHAERAGLLKAHGFALPPEKLAAVTEVNIASQGQVAGLALGRVMTLLLLFFIMSGGAVVATDLLAGEKERGTLETLLTTAASRLDVVVAKHLVIFLVAVIITLIQVANLLVYLGFKFIPVPAGFAAAVPPQVALLLVVLFLPVAAMATSVLLLTSGVAKSYKEAQLYFYPVVLLGLVPALTPLLPNLPLRSAIVLLPIGNLALAAKEILIGSFDWPMIALSWLVTAGAAVWTTRMTVRFLSAERLITATETDAVEFVGGPAFFGRQVWRWFVFLWGALLIVNNYVEKLDIRVQLFINLVVFFFGASLLMIRRYGLEPRAALALRAPRPIVLLAVLLAAPSSVLSGLGLFRLANLIFPVPTRLIEQFSEHVLPASIPLAQLLLFLCVLPGVFEEIAFRGLLLHGLHRRLHPALLACVVGLVFGLFHFALFRLLPTACLGILLAAVTLLTGSIFPAMLWHATSNAIGVLAGRLQIPVDELDPVMYLVGTVALAAALWVIWRQRTPYPGLRPWRRSPQR
jgi:sodium transport system permease protein